MTATPSRPWPTTSSAANAAASDPRSRNTAGRFPELAGDIREVFPVLIRMENLRSDGPDDSTGGVAVNTATRLTRLGDYRILREVGRGGMGVVYEAEQESLGRRVALKVLPAAALSDAQQVLRFQREARAAARLHHTNIVPVFGVGRDEGNYYYVMQFIPGMGLDAVLEELRRLRRGAGAASPADRPVSRGSVSAAAVAEAILTGRFSLTDPEIGAPVPNGATVTAAVTMDHPPGAPSPPVPPSVSLPGTSADSLARSDPDRTFFRSVARIGLQVAEALEYANRQGVLHRDVKPSNLLLDPKGNVWVADFGLAKAADAEDLTHSGDIVGTVRYMAPERFTGKCDARSDVYALGLTFYELLALRPAYSAADRHELMRRVMSEEPERLRKIVPNVPRDLETIVEKAIAREPAGRYPSAAALAEDLQRFLTDRPIKARRVSAAEQAWRWTRRNPVVTSLAAGLLLALLGGLVAVSWQWRQAVANLAAAGRANRKAQARFDLAMQAVKSFTTGASEDVILKEKALEGLRKKLLGQSRLFYEKLVTSLEGETDRASRSALAEALFEAGDLYGDVDDLQRASEAHRSALALRGALLRERPDDPVSRRDLARSHLALAGVLRSEGRIDEARQEVVRARGVLEPLVRERPDDGGALRLWAECDSLEGLLLALSGRLVEARADLQRARATFERLIHDDPPYTLPTAANGPTEYRRGLAEVLVGISKAFAREGRDDEAAKVWEAQRVVVEDLAAGRFADDADRRRLGLACSQHIERLSRLGRPDESIRIGEDGLGILERLVETNPTVVTYKIDLALCLANLGEAHRTQGRRPKARRLASRSLSILRSLTAEQKGAITLVMGEALDELTLAECDLDAGRFVDAREHIGRCLTICEDAARAQPEDLGLPQVHCNALVIQALIELSAGRAEAVLQAVGRLRDVAIPILRDRHDDRLVRDWYLSGLLAETMLQVKLGRMTDAATGAEQFAGEVERLKPPLNPVERFFHGSVHVLFFVLGRPAGSGRMSQPPGLTAHADRAVAEILEADRLGFRNPTATAMTVQLLPGRTELRLLLMDQRFPADPFMSDPSIEDGDPSTRIGGAIP